MFQAHIKIDKNRQSSLVIWCPKHNNEHSTTFYNYTRVGTTGCPCCGRAKVSASLKGRKFSAATLQKMTAAAQMRPDRGGEPRRWRENNTYRVWRASVLNSFNNECAVTGIKKQELINTNLEVHHLYCAHAHKHLVYRPENGIVLHPEIHKLFHLTYGFGSNTLEQFQSFLLSLLDSRQQNQQSMPISSQATPGGVEGSETRVYDPDRIKKLHERLEGVKQYLM